MLRSVAVLALDQVAPFELGVLCEVFGTKRDGFPVYDFTVCTIDGQSVRSRSGFLVQPHTDLAPLASADLICIPAHPETTEVPQQVLDALWDAHERGAWIISVCSGAFVLGQAGLLDGRRCTTHWMHSKRLAEQFPRAEVTPDALYIQDGRIITGAGGAAGIDACLHLVRQAHGADMATRLARRMVVAAHRAGGQAQFVETPLPEADDCPTLQPLLEWLLVHLDRTVTVEQLADRADMAPRTFARRFKAETGATPHDWITHQRILLARRLLEETSLSVEEVAQRCGFVESAALRHHFAKRVGTTPMQYRSTFRAKPALVS